MKLKRKIEAHALLVDTHLQITLLKELINAITLAYLKQGQPEK
jgi:hypothetical protein